MSPLLILTIVTNQSKLELPILSSYVINIAELLYMAFYILCTLLKYGIRFVQKFQVLWQYFVDHFDPNYFALIIYIVLLITNKFIYLLTYTYILIFSSCTNVGVRLYWHITLFEIFY